MTDINQYQKLYSQGKYSELFSILNSIFKNDSFENIDNKIIKLYAKCLFKEKKYELSDKMFQKVFQNEKSSLNSLITQTEDALENKKIETDELYSILNIILFIHENNRIEEANSFYISIREILSDEEYLVNNNKEELIQIIWKYFEINSILKNYSLKNLTINLEEILSIESYGYIYSGKLNDSKIEVRHFLFEEKFKTDSEFAYKILTEIFHEYYLYETFSSETQNVLKLLTVFTDYPNRYIYFVAEKIEGGKLRNILEDGIQISNKDKIDILIQIANIIKVFHSYSLPYIIYNLSTSILLLNNDSENKIKNQIKFYGFKCVNNSKKVDLHSLSLYSIAPELLKGENYDESVDIYSFGVVMWEIFSQKIPYKGILPKDLEQRIKNNNLLDVNDVAKETPKEIKEIICDCFKEKKKRPSIDDIIKILNQIKI